MAFTWFRRGVGRYVVTRLVGDHMSRTLGQTLVVENVGGAGGSIGMTRAAQAQPDGYTIAVGNMGTQSAAPALYPNLGYDPDKDFEPIGLISDGSWGLAASGVRAWFARSPRRLELIGGLGGLTMIGLGVTLALTGRRD